MTIARALLLALWCAYAAGVTPLSAATDDNDCALYLAGPGRTSAYDYSLNLLRGNFGYEGQHTCITYDAVNQAYLDARKRILVSQPKGDWKAEDYASVGELILDMSINLARTYGLTYEEIEKGLPLIDTSRTLIREVCPPVFSHVECRAGKYRRLDGLCNNLQHPTWGATMSPFQRLIGPLFADGINAPRIAHNGHDLPLSRVVSRTMHPDEGFHDHAGTVMVIAWGQFMDHDYTLTATPLDPVHRNDPEECCKRPLHLKHPYCNEIRIPDDDYFYRLFGVKCIDFVRGFPSPRPGCRLGSRVPYNVLTGAIDGNTVYGVTEKFARKLRTGYGGLLRMNPVFKEYGLKDLLPLKLDIPDEGCTRPNKNMYCFEAGEIRVNEQLVLTVMHTLMAREHNRVAVALAEVNPHWDDETLFQEARRINIAEIQHITYNEFLPILLGKDVMEKFGLVLEKDGYWDGYDPNVNPDVIASFAAAAYRFGHSLLPTAVERWSKAHKFIASKRLSDLIRRPYDLYRAGVLDEYVMGLMNQVAQAMDDSITQEVTNHLFKKVGARFGMDLVSFNMQRGREFGVPGYMEFRKFCGLSGAETFQDLFGSMPNETVRKYETIFEHPVDVDLWSGGVSERPLPGSMLGPTFACIIATQFSYSRRGDRFWFELPHQPSSFTPEQLKEVRKARLARVICDNTDIIDTVQLYPMVLPDHELNPRVPCRSGIIPSMDFSKWAEPAPFAGTAKQFMTEAHISPKNESDLCDEIIEQTTVPINIKNINNHTDATNVNQDSPCNYTLLNIQQEPNITKSEPENNTVGVTDIEECAEDIKVATNDCLENLTPLNEITDNDKVLKYIYKKNEEEPNPQKSRGHIKNRVERKKRSVEETDRSIRDIPTVVDYKTSQSKDLEATQVNKRSANIIKGADFNIETVHERHPRKNSVDDSEKFYYKEKRPTYSRQHLPHESFKNTKERETYNNNRRNYREESDESSEESKEGKENIRKSEHIRDNSESSENSNTRHNKATYSKPQYESRGSDESNSPSYNKNSKESQESQESKESSEINNKSAYTKPNDVSIESNEKDKLPYKKENSEESKENDYYTDIRKSNLGQGTESSEESLEKVSLNSKKYESSNNIEQIKNRPNSSSASIQDIDRGDFRYENIKVNKEGQLDTVKDSHENYNVDSSLEVKPLSTFKPSIDNKENIEVNTLPKETSVLPPELSEDIKQPININDGEIKPVVEINSESNESSEENNKLKELQKASLNIADKSIETLGDGKDAVNNEKKDKLIEQKDEKGDVKQQFERIPLNYNHDNKKQDTDKNDDINSKTVEGDSGSIKEEKQSDGTLDTLTPKEEQYDENLNFKFDDIRIELPEIKLPEDILSYAYEEPSYEKRDKEKDKFYHYDDEVSKENIRDQKNRDHEDDEDEHNDDDDGYYGYGYNNEKKENYKKKKNSDDDEEADEEENNETEDVDLYEKFVRERFGKKGSFEKRSEKLRDNARHIPENPQLFETIHKVLKKAEETQKEAEKSGDPNAAYLWTLEYGQNL